MFNSTAVILFANLGSSKNVTPVDPHNLLKQMLWNYVISINSLNNPLKLNYMWVLPEATRRLA